METWILNSVYMTYQCLLDKPSIFFFFLVSLNLNQKKCRGWLIWCPLGDLTNFSFYLLLWTLNKIKPSKFPVVKEEKEKEEREKKERWEEEKLYTITHVLQNTF